MNVKLQKRKDSDLSCPLCACEEVEFYFQDQAREYHQCSHCDLVFVPGKFHLSPEEEKKCYDFHENNSEDEGYRGFLNRLFEPLLQKIKSNSLGLDFGSGPGPTLSLMFEEHGHTVKIYDQFYAQDESVFKGSYDFITATEVFEHLRDPQKEITRLWNSLKPGGFLGVMTKLVLGREHFPSWHYHRDPTHISFFSERTVEYLAKTLNAELDIIGNDVIFLKKKT